MRNDDDNPPQEDPPANPLEEPQWEYRGDPNRPDIEDRSSD